MNKLNDNDYLSLVVDVGNCFVADNAYQIYDDVREATLRVAKHFVSFEKINKGLALVGQNGTGKSLLMKIMGVIAPHFGKRFSRVKATMMGLNASKYTGRDALLIDDFGQDVKKMSWGNTLDVVYKVIDYRAELRESGISNLVYLTTNLSVAGYKAIGERYDARIFDRLTGMVEFVVFGDNDSTSNRTKTEPIYPNMERVDDIVQGFILNKMGLDLSSVIHPIVLNEIDKTLLILRAKYAKMLRFWRDEKILSYFAARRLFDVHLNVFRELVYSSPVAIYKYERKYLEILEAVNGAEWVLPDDYSFKLTEIVGSGTKIKRMYEEIDKQKLNLSGSKRKLEEMLSISSVLKS